MLLSLDLSISSPGIAIFSDSGSPELITSLQTSSKDETKDRLKEIGNFLEEIKNQYKITEVAFERGFTRYNRSTQTLYEVLGVAMYIFHDYTQFFYAPSTIKKIVTGNGKSDKKIVEEYVLKMWPTLTFTDNDQSDACAVGMCHMIKTGKIKNGKYIQ